MSGPAATHRPEAPSVRLQAGHGLAWAERQEHGALGVCHLVECQCGARFVRPRLADCALALERHQAHPTTFLGDGAEVAPSCLPTGNRRRRTAGDLLPSEVE